MLSRLRRPSFARKDLAGWSPPARTHPCKKSSSPQSVCVCEMLMLDLEETAILGGPWLSHSRHASVGEKRELHWLVWSEKIPSRSPVVWSDGQKFLFAD